LDFVLPVEGWKVNFESYLDADSSNKKQDAKSGELITMNQSESVKNVKEAAKSILELFITAFHCLLPKP
jgi:hypothetical protein